MAGGNGMVKPLRVLLLASGIVHSALSKLMSTHSALTSSPIRTQVDKSILIAMAF